MIHGQAVTRAVGAAIAAAACWAVRVRTVADQIARAAVKAVFAAAAMIAGAAGVRRAATQAQAAARRSVHRLCHRLHLHNHPRRARRAGKPLPILPVRIVRAGGTVPAMATVDAGVAAATEAGATKTEL